MKKDTFHMSPEEFRKHGHAVVDWIAEYMNNIENFPVVSRVKPGEVRSKLPDNAPDKGEPFEAILSDIDSIIMPGITHWQHPNFFAYFPANASGPSILGDLLSSGLGIQGMLWATSPACTELESHVLDWIVDDFGLDQKFKSNSTGGGVIQDSASNAALTAILSARERKTKYETNSQGLSITGPKKLVAYASDQTHSSLEKGIKIAGIGSVNLRMIKSDSTFAMDTEELEKAILKDIENGFLPFFICGTVGTTASNGFDPIDKVGEIARKHDLWLHVDAAMSGTATICPEFRSIIKGIEFADSYCFNPHKWLFTNFDCNIFYVSDKSELIKTLSILPEYLKNKATESGAVTDYRDWHIPLGRRFRSLKLWFVLRHYGIEGIRHHVREHVSLAKEFTSWVIDDNRFELLLKPKLNLVCFRLKSNDKDNLDLMEKLNASGKLFLTHAKLNSKIYLRMAIGQTYTKREHVVKAWALIRQYCSEAPTN